MEMVMPERDVPGTTATACASPIQSPSRSPMLSSPLEDVPGQRAGNRSHNQNAEQSQPHLGRPGQRVGQVLPRLFVGGWLSGAGYLAHEVFEHHPPFAGEVSQHRHQGPGM
jgi:hypothetical protein